MTEDKRPWQVLLTAAAEADFQDILRWTVEQFGEAQARAYAQTISDALAALTEGPAAIGVRTRNDIAQGIMTLHVARRRKGGRHLAMFRVARDRGRNVIEVLRLLHDAMDFVQHLPPPEDDRGEP